MRRAGWLLRSVFTVGVIAVLLAAVLVTDACSLRARKAEFERAMGPVRDYCADHRELGSVDAQLLHPARSLADLRSWPARYPQVRVKIVGHWVGPFGEPEWLEMVDFVKEHFRSGRPEESDAILVMEMAAVSRESGGLLPLMWSRILEEAVLGAIQEGRLVPADSATFQGWATPADLAGAMAGETVVGEEMVKGRTGWQEALLERETYRALIRNADLAARLLREARTAAGVRRAVEEHVAVHPPWEEPFWSRQLQAGVGPVPPSNVLEMCDRLEQHDRAWRAVLGQGGD